MNKKLFHLIFILIVSYLPLVSAQTLYLKDNLQRAQPGDYIVITANKTNTLMHIYGRQNQFLIVEEIAAPMSRKTTKMDWHTWIKNNAPGHNSWVMYEIDLNTGKMQRYYSFTKQGWYEIPEVDNFLSKLLNLRLDYIPESERKKVGLKIFAESEEARIWQPNLVVEGQIIRGVRFDAWRTRWPKDGSDLSNKAIELYLPHDNQFYPSYFPYWLQIQNAIGKSRVRIIDSGTNMWSPKPPMMSRMPATPNPMMGM